MKLNDNEFRIKIANILLRNFLIPKHFKEGGEYHNKELIITDTSFKVKCTHEILFDIYSEDNNQYVYWLIRGAISYVIYDPNNPTQTRQFRVQRFDKAYHPCLEEHSLNQLDRMLPAESDAEKGAGNTNRKSFVDFMGAIKKILKAALKDFQLPNKKEDIEEQIVQYTGNNPYAEYQVSSIEKEFCYKIAGEIFNSTEASSGNLDEEMVDTIIQILFNNTESMETIAVGMMLQNNTKTTYKWVPKVMHLF